MALIIILLRTIGSLVFGAVVFVSFLGFLLANEVQVHLLDDSFYTRPLAENDIYNRIYDELLIDPELAKQSQRLLGDFDIPTRDAIALSRKVITPRYLQTQVEANISSVMTYLKKESYDPKAYIELGLPIVAVLPPGAAQAMIEEHEIGLVAALGDVNGLARCIERMVEDALLRTRCRANMLRLREQFRPARQVRKWRDNLLQLMEKKSFLPAADNASAALQSAAETFATSEYHR